MCVRQGGLTSYLGSMCWLRTSYFAQCNARECGLKANAGRCMRDKRAPPAQGWRAAHHQPGRAQPWRRTSRMPPAPPALALRASQLAGNGCWQSGQCSCQLGPEAAEAPQPNPLVPSTATPYLPTHLPPPLHSNCSPWLQLATAKQEAAAILAEARAKALSQARRGASDGSELVEASMRSLGLAEGPEAELPAAVIKRRAGCRGACLAAAAAWCIAAAVAMLVEGGYCVAPGVSSLS